MGAVCRINSSQVAEFSLVAEFSVAVGDWNLATSERDLVYGCVRAGAMTICKPQPERVEEAKTRLCLKCRKQFKSSWPGERICTNCKSRISWREGADFEVRDLWVR